MPRIGDVLERESRSVDLEPGGFERLLGRRERKERNRRIRAGALGLILVLAAGIAFARSLTSESIPAGQPDEPRPLPVAPGTLAYVLDGDVYVADHDGSNPVKIADGLGEDECGSAEGFTYWAEGAMWSPDRRYLAYRRSDCPEGSSATRSDVVISDAAGNEIAIFSAAGWTIGWSPDSSRVAAWDPLFESVAIYGVEGARQARIAMPPGWQPSGDHDPAWLPDGTLGLDGVELPLDGSPARPLDPERAQEWSRNYSFVQIGMKAISPDGSRMAFVGGNGRSLDVEVPDGSGSVATVRLVGFEGETWVAVRGFSPDGERILFSVDSTVEGVGERSLRSIRIDGTDERILVEGTITGSWSPA